MAAFQMPCICTDVEYLNDYDELLKKEFDYQENLLQRKQDVLRIIETQGKLTDEIINAVNNAHKLKEVEDIIKESYYSMVLTLDPEKEKKDYLLVQSEDAKTEDEYLEVLTKEAILDMKALDRVRHIIKRNIEGRVVCFINNEIIAQFCIICTACYCLIGLCILLDVGKSNGILLLANHRNVVFCS